jgi:hypothetical protein
MGWRRRSTPFLICLALGAVLVFFMLFHSLVRQKADSPALGVSRETVKSLGLTDLCLFTEARYMRHPSQADLHSAFQDHPTALEHFPSGSFGGYGAGIKRFYGSMD